jgi:transcriptional regulator with XRE-family HTH domain
MAFNDNLVRIRELRGKKPTDVIAGADVSKGQYYAWENGEYEPNTDNLEKLSRFFKVPKEIFFKDSIADVDVLGDVDPNLEWFKRQIETLIQVKGEYINIHREVWDELKDDKKEIKGNSDAFKDEIKELWGLIKRVVPETARPNKG